MKGTKWSWIIVWLMLGFVFLETLCNSQLLLVAHQIRWVRWLELLAAVVVCILPFLSRKTLGTSSSLPENTWDTFFLWTKRLGFASFAVILISMGAALLDNHPFQKPFSIILHIYETNAIRFLAGNDPYFFIEQIWNGEHPVYLAGRWLAYIPAILLKLDIRWIDLSFLLLGLLLLWNVLQGTNRRLNQLSCLLLLPLGYLGRYLLEQNTGFLTGSGESVVFGWYFLLAWAISKQRFQWQGFAIAMCLLTRPALIVWLPMWLFLLYRYQSPKAALKVFWISAMCLTAFLIIPFAWQRGDYFTAFPQSSLLAAVKAWEVHQGHFIRSLGFASFFAPDKLGGLLWLRFALLLTVSAATIGYMRRFYNQETSPPLSIIGLTSLKLSCLAYYLLHPQPFDYLFPILAFLSLFLLAAVYQDRLVLQKASEQFQRATDNLANFHWRSPQGKAVSLLLGLVAAVTIEGLCNTRFVMPPFTDNFAWSSILYFLAGITIALIPLWKVKAKTIPTLLPDSNGYLVAGIKWLVILLIGTTLWQNGDRIIQTHPLVHTESDMLPIIEIQANRYVNGEEIYAPMTEFWGGQMIPIYLPGFWAPFVPAAALGVDIRYTTLVVLIASLFLLLSCYPIFKRNQNLFVLLSLIPVLLVFESIWLEQERVIRFTQEGVVIFYYLLLGVGLIRKNIWLIGISIGLCLMSRFSLVPWLPFFGLYIFFFEDRARAIKIALIPAALILLIFLIPFGELWEYFFFHPQRYQGMAERIWDKNTAFFVETLGLAKFLSADLVRMQHKLHFSLAFLTPAIMLVLYWKTKLREKWSPTFFALCSLKMTLVVFYNFIVLPVFYLFYVNTILSCLILFAYIGQYIKGNKSTSPSII